MNKSKAIELLGAEIKSLEKTGVIFDKVYETHIKQLVKSTCGETSEYFRLIPELELSFDQQNAHAHRVNRIRCNLVNGKEDYKRIELQDLLRNCIKYVEANGVYIDPNKNFLAGWSNAKIYYSIIGGSISIVGLTYAVLKVVNLIN